MKSSKTCSLINSIKYFNTTSEVWKLSLISHKFPYSSWIRDNLALNKLHWELTRGKTLVDTTTTKSVRRISETIRKPLVFFTFRDSKMNTGAYKDVYPKSVFTINFKSRLMIWQRLIFLRYFLQLLPKISMYLP